MDSLRRLKVLQKLGASLGSYQTETTLAEAVSKGLVDVFGPLVEAEMLVYVPTANALLPARGRQRARELLALLESTEFSVTDSERANTEGEPLRVARVLDRDPGDRHGSVLAAPLLDDPHFHGLIVLEREPDEADFTVGDLQALCGVAGQVALRISILREEPSESSVHRAHDMRHAREVQRRLLPTLPPEMGGMRVDACYQPAYAVGGDFYDLISTGEGRVLAVIGDVAGHGVAAALLMSRVTSEFRAVSRHGLSPSAILEALNRALEGEIPDHNFVTAACLAVDTRTGFATGASAGHVPILVRRANGTVETHVHAGGAPLGMVADETYADQSFEVGPGDTLMMVTDGLVEALGDTAAPSGVRPWASVLARAPSDVRELNAYVMAKVAATARRRPDDVAVLTMQIVPRPR